MENRETSKVILTENGRMQCSYSERTKNQKIQGRRKKRESLGKKMQFRSNEEQQKVRLRVSKNIQIIAHIEITSNKYTDI